MSAFERFRFAASSGARAKVPALQNVALFGGATAAWQMNKVSGGLFNVADRTGNGHALELPNPVFVPDSIPGEHAFFCYPPLTNGVQGLNGPAQFTGAVSLTGRIAHAPSTRVSLVDAWLFADGDYGVGLNTTFAVLAYNATTPHLMAYWEPSSVVVDSGLSIPLGGQECFVSVCRAGDGRTVDFGIDGVFATVVAPSGPGAGIASKIELGGHYGQSPAAGTFPGLLADMVVWPVALTRDQVQVQRAIAMAL